MFRKLGPLQRRMLRVHVSQLIANGELPEEAAVVLLSGEAFTMLDEQVADLADSDPQHARLLAPTNLGQPGHPFLTFLLQNAPAIIAFITSILPLFGVPVPPITLPTLPGVPSGHAATAARADTAAHAATSAHGAMPTDFAIPLTPAVASLVQMVAQALIPALTPVVSKLVEQAKAELFEWLKSQGATEG